MDNLTDRLMKLKNDSDLKISRNEANNIATLITEEEATEQTLINKMSDGNFDLLGDDVHTEMENSKVTVDLSSDNEEEFSINDITDDDIISDDIILDDDNETSIDIENEDIENNESNQKEPIQLTREERAKLAKEKYNSIKMDHTPKEVKHNNDEIGSELFETMEKMDKENQENINKMNKIIEDNKKDEVTKDKNNIPSHDLYDSDIDELINSMVESEEFDVETEDKDENDLEKALEEIEAEKMFAEIQPNDEHTGPSNYIIEEDELYTNTVEDVLTSNNINIVKKNANERNAILDRFVNSGDKVSMTLVNSDIFVTTSGAGTTEIISMHQMENEDSEMRAELNKLDHVCKHITGSSIGRMKINQLVKVISYYDKDSLYYALFAATHPAESEYTRVCSRCGKEYHMKINTRDLLLNPEDFAKDAENIRDNVTTYNRLIKESKLNKIYKQSHKNRIIISYKHPSIESYLKTKSSITNETMTKYPSLVEFAYSIHKIALLVKGNDYIEYTDPNEIIKILSQIKDVDLKYEIFDMIDSIRPNAIPTYGFKESNCPHCGGKNEMSTFSMESLLFTTAQQEEYMATLKWAAKMQKRRNEQKK